MSDVENVAGGEIAARVELTNLDGRTPAQLALSEAGIVQSATPEAEQRLFDLFGIIERVIHPDYSGRYGALLQQIAENQIYDDVEYLGLLNAPDGTNHEVFGQQGGLLKRMLRHWAIWLAIKDGKSTPEEWGYHLDAGSLEDEDVNDENVLIAIVHEAIPLAWAHFIEAPVRGKQIAIPGQHESVRLMNDAGKAMLLLQEARIIVEGPHLHLMLPNLERFPESISPLAQIHLDLFVLATVHH